MTSTDQCEDCGRPATVAMASVGVNRSGKSNTSQGHRYCRPCAERHGVPKRESLPPRRLEGEGIEWDGLLRFYQLMEKQASHYGLEQRASAREAALEFRDFLDHPHREAPPPELREVIDRIIKSTA